MPHLRRLSSRPELLVDNRGAVIADPTTAGEATAGRVGFVVGFDGARGGERLVFALPTDQTGGMPSVRYHPPWSGAVGELVTFGMSFENVIPPGVQITGQGLTVYTDTVPPGDDGSIVVGTVEVRGRRLYATVTGGVDGTDYLFVWEAIDSQGNVWPRTALALCSLTS